MQIFNTFITFLLVSINLLAVEIDSDKRINIRQNITQCASYLIPKESSPTDSVGIQLHKDNMLLLRSSIREIREKGQVSLFENATIYITGVNMGHAQSRLEEYKQILEEEGIDSNLPHYKLLTIPELQTENFNKLNEELAKIRDTISQVDPKVLLNVLNDFSKYSWERIKYFAPSIERDYQKPTKGEVSTGLTTNALIEMASIKWLVENNNPFDAALTLVGHVGFLSFLTIYQRSTQNWLERSQSNIEGFTKQSLIGLAFIANYNIFQNASAISNFYTEFGLSGLLQQLPSEIATFAATQGLTFTLQTLFYYISMTKGIRKWVTLQQGEERTLKARAYSNIIALPFLALDALFLAQAASPHSPVIESLSYGVLQLNQGHLLLSGLILASSILVAIKPTILNPAIDIIDWFIQYLRKFREFLIRATQKVSHKIRHTK